MIACASGGWRVIGSCVISSDMPFILRKSSRVTRLIPGGLPPAVAGYPWIVLGSISVVGNVLRLRRVQL